MDAKAIIFDLDGVICYTDQYHYQAWKEMADNIGVHFDETINNRLRGISRMASLEIILENSEREYSAEEKEALATGKNERYRELLSEMTEANLSDEVKSTLEELRRRGILLAIGSSSRNARLILGRLGIEDMFDAISDGNNIVRSKPDPEVFLKAAEYLGVQPSEAMVVEDAKAGIDAAVAGGFTSAGIGEASEHEKVTYPITSFADILNI